MNKKDKCIINCEVNEMLSGQLEELILIKYYLFLINIKSIFLYGFDNDISIEVKKMSSEFSKIKKEEKRLLNRILDNLDFLDYLETEELVSELDSVNDKTISYYYENIDNLDECLDTKRFDRAKRKYKNFDTIIETNNFKDNLDKLEGKQKVLTKTKNR